MKFLCDVHISYKLVKHIESFGYTAVHVNTILDKWFSKDADIIAYADLHDFIIVSKDADFRNSYFLKKQPRKLIKINLGNTSNNRLIEIFSELLILLEKVDTSKAFLIEIDETDISYSN